ncbi:hypothetical protein [Zunongwangia sp.]|uniref:hypothetical protein n=1 Tax=Zunongwangia sp. TaxID=1965325 RepID=UPI003AA8987E
MKYSYKFEVKNDNLFIEINDQDIFIGKVIDENKELIIYKKYLSYLVVLDKENYTFTTERSSDLGFYEEKDIYPRIINSSADLKEDEEFILWSTISYRSMLKTNSPE